MNTNTEQTLAEKNINPTAMRILVLNSLSQKKSAVSLTDIEKTLETADRTTIYRTLKTFAEKGLIHIIDDGTGLPKYALCPDNCDAGGHHDLHYIERAEPPAYVWLGRHVLPPVRR